MLHARKDIKRMDAVKVLKTGKWVSIFAVAFALSILVVAKNSAAQNNTDLARSSVLPSPARVAFVDIQKVITACEEGKAESAKWQQWSEEQRAALQTMQKELDALKNQLDIQGAKLTDEARGDLESNIEAKQLLLQRTQQDTQREADRREERITNSMYRKVLPVIAKIAEEKYLDSVHFVDPNRDAYIRPSLMITDEVIKAYNEAHPVISEQQSPGN